MTEVVHIASQAVQVGTHVRQRCVWCGDELIDQDLALVMRPIEQADTPYPTWPTGGLIARDGGATYVVPYNEGDQLPESACVAPNTLRGLLG